MLSKFNNSLHNVRSVSQLEVCLIYASLFLHPKQQRQQQQEQECKINTTFDF